MTKVVVDTNYLIENGDLESLVEQYEITIPLICLEEMDNLNHNSLDQNKKYKIRNAIRQIEKLQDKIDIDINKYDTSIACDFEDRKNDNKILACCKGNEAMLLTYDCALKIKAKSIGIECVETEYKEIDDYKGYKVITLDEYELANFYECQINKWDLDINEYIVIKDESGEIVDKLKWTNKGFKSLSYKTVDSRYVGKVKPRNLQQELYMDLLQDKETKVKIVQGEYGTGKDYCALAQFLQLVEKGVFQKIIWVRNNIEADGTKPIGYLPGNLTEKLSVFADIVGDFVGDKVGFEMLLNSGKLELVHTGFLRGRDLRNSIIYCTEAQNMSDSLVKLILSRVSEGSIAFFNGDVKQIDDRNFKVNNGLRILVEKLKGHPLFGYVYLNKCERSEVAQLAALLD